MADDHSVKRLYVPEEFSLEARENEDVHTGFGFLSDKSVLYMFYMKSERKGAEEDLEASGYQEEQIKSGKVHYAFVRGIYADQVSPVPDEADLCVVSVVVIPWGRKSEMPVIAQLLKSRKCDDIDDFGEYQQSKLKHELYDILELR